MRTSQLLAVLLLTGIAAAACADQTPTVTEATAASPPDHPGALASAANLSSDPPPPILIEPLMGRHEFTDAVGARIGLQPQGRPLKVINLYHPSKLAVLRITVQPGARFPWHTHPGPVLVAVTQGELVYVYADDCVERPYPAGTAFVDPGSNVHYAFNPTGGETVVVATFFGAPATGPLTIPVDADETAALDRKCGSAPASSHTH